MGVLLNLLDIKVSALPLVGHRVYDTNRGSVESELHPEIILNSSIAVHPIQPIPNFIKTKKNRFFLFFGPLKVLFQAWNLWLVLGYKTRPSKWMLVQVSLKAFLN